MIGQVFLKFQNFHRPWSNSPFVDPPLKLMENFFKIFLLLIGKYSKRHADSFAVKIRTIGPVFLKKLGKFVRKFGDFQVKCQDKCQFFSRMVGDIRKVRIVF